MTRTTTLEAPGLYFAAGGAGAQIQLDREGAFRAGGSGLLSSRASNEAATILLAESAKSDPDIVSKIKGQLVAGKKVVVTSGLFKALQDEGLRDIIELSVTDRKAGVRQALSAAGLREMPYDFDFEGAKVLVNF